MPKINVDNDFIQKVYTELTRDVFVPEKLDSHKYTAKPEAEPVEEGEPLPVTSNTTSKNFPFETAKVKRVVPVQAPAVDLPALDGKANTISHDNPFQGEQLYERTFNTT